MDTQEIPTPRKYLGVTISSTFTDLKSNRAALIKTIRANELTDVAMENDAAKLMDVIDSSLQMVRDGSAYIGIISKKYGQIPKCPQRNPDNLSITELEFNEALRLNRPILLFIMGKDHLVHERDIEVNRARKKKLDDFRERAKRMNADSLVHRVYAEFQSLDEFKDKIGPSIAALSRHLNDTIGRLETNISIALPVLAEIVAIPTPPHFYPAPPYIGTHRFLGRQAQLDVLNDWARPADSHAILLFEAIGGTGKSILTWEWITNHATAVRNDWAGRFWYSFYEKGAAMADFCQHALAYITGQPLEEFHKKKSRELAQILLGHLRTKPWLFVLDGLERVLVAYHRLDAAEVRDEIVNQPSDLIAHRDPCNAIHPEDDDFLKALSAAAPSKILMTSRLTPRVLLNPARQPIPGVLRVALPGLRPNDAEALFRLCGITGDSRAIQDYLKQHCDCHPLVTGVLAGLINDYLPDRGNFDKWVRDTTDTGQLDFSDLDLIQKRNHILAVALDSLPEETHQFMSLLAMFGEAIDYNTLLALNSEVSPSTEDANYLDYYEELRLDRLIFGEQRTPFSGSSPRTSQEPVPVQEGNKSGLSGEELTRVVTDLEARGLLQYDHQAKRYDLHPVVRGIVSSKLDKTDKQRVGQRVVDYFSQQSHIPYQDAETLDDLSSGLRIVRTLIQMGQLDRACSRYLGVLCNPLLFNLEAHAELLSIERPFFKHGWATLPVDLGEASAQHLASDAARALQNLGQLDEALEVYSSLITNCLDNHAYHQIPKYLSAGVGQVLHYKRRTGDADRLTVLALHLATLLEDEGQLNMRRMDRFTQLSDFGRFKEADTIWKGISVDKIATYYRKGWAEYRHAVLQLYRNTLKEEELVSAEQAAQEGKDRYTIRALHALRGEWLERQKQWLLASESWGEAVRLARIVGKSDGRSELRLKLAQINLDQIENPIREVEQLEEIYPSHFEELADLWLLLDQPERARNHALKAYKDAWGDGEPYVWRYRLNKAIALLERIGEPIPDLPRWDPINEAKFPWEDRLLTVMAELRKGKERGQTL